MSDWRPVPEVLFYDLKPPLVMEDGKVTGPAPFDGKPVLIYDPNCRAEHDCAKYVADVPCIMAAKWVGACWWGLLTTETESWVEGDGLGEECITGTGVRDLHPTLWMPLDKLPSPST